MKCHTEGLQTSSQKKVKLMRPRKSKQLDPQGPEATPDKGNRMS